MKTIKCYIIIIIKINEYFLVTDEHNFIHILKF